MTRQTLTKIEPRRVLDPVAAVDGVYSDAWAQTYDGKQPLAATLQRLDDFVDRAMPVVRSALNDALHPATDETVGGYLIMLGKAFPRPEGGDPAAFAVILLEDVLEMRPSIGALDAGCKAVRRTSKFMPAIAEVLEAIRSADVRIRLAVSRLDDMPQLRADLAARLKMTPR